jgi:hypothetical protein
MLLQQGSYGEIDNNSLHYLLEDCRCYLSLGPLHLGTETYLHTGQREAVGAFNLLEQLLSKLPDSQWPAKFEQLNQKTYFPLKLVALDSIKLGASQ